MLTPEQIAAWEAILARQAKVNVLRPARRTRSTVYNVAEAIAYKEQSNG